jgi:hypothetical protein
MVTCILTSRIIVITCWTGTPFVVRIDCSSLKFGILVEYWFYTNYSIGGTSFGWVTSIASPFFPLEING